MKLIRMFALSAVVFYLTQENETDGLIARMIEGGTNLAIDIGLKLIKIPIMLGGKIVWKCIKVPAKFVWDLAKIPFKVIARLAWKFSKKPLKAITPQYIQDSIRQQVRNYQLNKKKRKQMPSRMKRFKAAVNNRINRLENRQKMRKQRYQNNL